MKDIIYGEKKSIFWNFCFSIMSSLQSAIMVLVVTRALGTSDAGVISIAFATAYLMSNIGGFGMRNFHATDTLNNYSYCEYKKARIITCLMMILGSILYCHWKQYEDEKLFLVFLVCGLKVIEAIEDLFHGELQRESRLDTACFLGSVRLLVSYIIFAIVVAFTKNLPLTMSIVVAVNFLIVLLFEKRIAEQNVEFKGVNGPEKHFSYLLVECFPLFVISFFSIYISNAPKYAIDAYMANEEQAYYAILSMPVFTINLLSGVIYRPQLVKMAEMWNDQNKQKIKKTVFGYVRIICGIFFAISAIGLTIGLKLLEILYDVELAMYRAEFGILLLGGGLIAIVNLGTACIVIMRKQSIMIGMPILVTIVTQVISAPLVKSYGLMGAACLNCILIGIELIIVIVVLGKFMFYSND